MYIFFRSSLQTMAPFSNHSDLRLEGWSYMLVMDFTRCIPSTSPNKGIMWETLASLDQANLGSFHAANRIRGTTLVIERFRKWYELAGSGCLFSLEVSYIYLHPGNMEPQNDGCCTKKILFERIHVQIPAETDVFCCLKKIAWSVLDLFLDGGHFSRAGC